MRVVGLSVLAGLLLTGPVLAEEPINERRAHFNYQMFCQGCHTPDGVGGEGVPRMKDELGHFLKTERGRKFLVQVPGSANAPLNDARLAEVLNWMLKRFSGSSLSSGAVLYSEQEVAELRQQPLNEVDRYRAELVAEIQRVIQQ